jgi:uncharacterized protein involved in exopolysaccharide biosynthesis
MSEAMSLGENEHKPDELLRGSDLLYGILRRKVMIIAIVLAAAGGTAYWLTHEPNIYRSSAILEPVAMEGGSVNGASLAKAGGVLGSLLAGNVDAPATLDKMAALLEDRAAMLALLDRYRLTDDLLPREYDGDVGIAVRREGKGRIDLWVHRVLLKSTKLERDKVTGLITISADHHDPQVARDLVLMLVDGLSRSLRAHEIRRTGQAIAEIKAELAAASTPDLQRELTAIVGSLIRSRVMSGVGRYYGFDMLVAPRVATPDEKVWPNRTVITLFAGIAAFVVAAILAMMLEIASRMSAERRRRLLGALRLRAAAGE